MEQISFKIVQGTLEYTEVYASSRTNFQRIAGQVVTAIIDTQKAYQRANVRLFKGNEPLELVIERNGVSLLDMRSVPENSLAGRLKMKMKLQNSAASRARFAVTIREFCKLLFRDIDAVKMTLDEVTEKLIENANEVKAQRAANS